MFCLKTTIENRDNDKSIKFRNDSIKPPSSNKPPPPE